MAVAMSNYPTVPLPTSRRPTSSPPGVPAGGVPGAGPARPGALLAAMFWDVGLAVLAYYGARAAGLSEWSALLAGTLAAGARLLWVAARNRRVDPFAGVLLVLFAAGLAVSFVTGDARFLLAKDSATSGVLGLTFLGSCLAGKPLCYLAALRMAGPARGQLAGRFAVDAAMRRRFSRLTLIWGGGLLVEALLRIAVVYLLPIDVAVGASTALQVAALTALVGWTVLQTKRGQAHRADRAHSSGQPGSPRSSGQPDGGPLVRPAGWGPLVG
jgi:hypothetical protein